MRRWWRGKRVSAARAHEATPASAHARGRLLTHGAHVRDLPDIPLAQIARERPGFEDCCEGGGGASGSAQRAHTRPRQHPRMPAVAHLHMQYMFVTRPTFHWLRSSFVIFLSWNKLSMSVTILVSLWWKVRSKSHVKCFKTRRWGWGRVVTTRVTRT